MFRIYQSYVPPISAEAESGLNSDPIDTLPILSSLLQKYFSILSEAIQTFEITEQYLCSSQPIEALTSTKMRAISVHEGGTADDLYIEDNIPDPEAKGDELLVKIKAFGINRMDVGQRSGKYPAALVAAYGKILGVEFSGIVEEKGPDGMSQFCLDQDNWNMLLMQSLATEKFKIGDQVFGLAKGNAVRYTIDISWILAANFFSMPRKLC